VVVVSICFCGLLILVGVLGYIYFAIKKPDYLRSEEYQLKKQSLEILGNEKNTMQLDGQTFVEIVSNSHQSEKEG
jgi:hypothetical protein